MPQSGRNLQGLVNFGIYLVGTAWKVQLSFESFLWSAGLAFFASTSSIPGRSHSSVKEYGSVLLQDLRKSHCLHKCIWPFDIRHHRVMRRCLRGLLPTSRSLCYGKLRSKLHSESCLHLPTVLAVSAAGARYFSKCDTAYWRDFKKGQKNPTNKKQSDTQSTSQEPLRDSAAWIDALEVFLSPHLRSPSNTSNRSTLPAKEKCAAITQIIFEARGDKIEVDVLAELGLKHGRWSAVLSVVEALISDSFSHNRDDPVAQLPSNLGWPISTLLEDMVFEPVEVNEVTSSSRTSSALMNESHSDLHYTNTMDAEKHIALEQIWMSLGSIILGAAELPSEQSKEAMKSVYQIIARLHNFGLVPEHVYSYVLPSFDSVVHRPPIMHLLSSRILTTISDAVWRAHQDDAIAKATNAGAKYGALGHEPPGGRFRLKVRELGPEVWLEFILWCCVDGGYATAGSWIVERMRTRNVESPWFAAQWNTLTDDDATDKAPVDWARVTMRHGGTVGQIEGYSFERPFVEMKSRTISVEVVLALVETSINGRKVDIAGQFGTQEPALNSITKLLTFLEPHTLTDRYFDYLTVRLLQPLLFDFANKPTALQTLVDKLSYMRSLENACKPAGHLPSLEISSLLAQSEVYAGVLHQTLESFAVAGRVRPTIEVFSQIQDLVDQSKLQSIGSFWHAPRQPDQSFFSPRQFAFSHEFTSSHGQLPAQKLGLVLDAVTDAGLVELGQWLLYSTDVDGPVIPLSLYHQLSLTPSLLRFAALTQDHMLIRDVAESFKERRRLPAVRSLRSLADAELALKNFDGAGHAFGVLNKAKGGGNDLRNIASVIATIIKIESASQHMWQERRARVLSPGMALLEWLLGGDFEGIPGDFRRDYIQDYRRSLACLLRVVEAIPATTLSIVAQSWIRRSVGTNVLSLHPRVFDIVLSAVVETKGAKVGMMLWDLFCEEPGPEGEKIQSRLETADTKSISPLDGAGFHSDESPPGPRIWTRSDKLPTRIDEFDTEAAANDLDMDGTSEDASLTDWYGIKTPVNESDAGYVVSSAANEQSNVNVNEFTPSIISFDGHDHAKDVRPAGYELAVLEERNSTLQENLPNADISLRPGAFIEMISESSTPDATEDDVNLHVPSPNRRSPVVRPTFRTLRIIIRSALQELESAKALWYMEDLEVPSLNTTEVPANANMRALEAAITDIELVEQWATPLLRRFGLSDNDVAVEFGWNMGEKDNVFSTADLKKKYAVAKTEYELAKIGMLADISEVDIRKRFFGPNIRKAEGNVKKYTAREIAFYWNSNESSKA